MAESKQSGAAVPEVIETIGAELGVDVVPVAAGLDADACSERLEAMAKVLDTWGPQITGNEQDVPVIEWTVDYALAGILGLEHDNRVALMDRYVEIMLIYWYRPLLRVMPVQTVKARLLAAALDKKELSDSQVKMLRFKYARSMEGLGNR